MERKVAKYRFNRGWLEIRPIEDRSGSADVAEHVGHWSVRLNRRRHQVYSAAPGWRFRFGTHQMRGWVQCTCESDSRRIIAGTHQMRGYSVPVRVRLTPDLAGTHHMRGVGFCGNGIGCCGNGLRGLPDGIDVECLLVVVDCLLVVVECLLVVVE